MQKSHETIPAKDEPLLINKIDQSLHLRVETSAQTAKTNEAAGTTGSISTFDKILIESANVQVVKGQPGKVGSVMSGSRQKSRKNKVILPKIMFYKQSPKQPEGMTGITSMENSDRLISIDRTSAGGDPLPGLNQINQSMEDNLWNIENNYKTESVPRHEQTIDLIPAADANSTLIFDYEV